MALPSRIVFASREEAGRRLAEELARRGWGDEDTVLLALPRGGVPVAYEVAHALNLPLDVLVVRKLGVPGQEELAMGAIASGGVRLHNDDVIRMVNVSQHDVDRIADRELAELERREERYRGGRARADVEGKTVVLIDDGVATGATMRAAVRAARALGASEVRVAVPAAAPDTAERLAAEADALVALDTPSPFGGVGGSYRRFEQTSDEEVERLLRRG